MVKRKLVKPGNGQVSILIPAYVRDEMGLLDVEMVDVTMMDKTKILITLI